MSFAAATVLQKRYGAAYGIPAYLLAAYVGYSRIHAHRHYLTDIAAGASIGILIGTLFTRAFKHHIYLSTMVDPKRGVVLQLEKRF